MSGVQATIIMTSLFVSAHTTLLLDNNCVDWEYWFKGSSCLLQSYGYCTCHLVNSTGTVAWYTSKGKLANQEMATNQTTSKLIVQFPASKSVRNETFVCKVISATKPEEKIFKTKYLYGPGSISLRLANTTSNNVDLCPGKPREATVYCEVPASSVYPEPWFHMEKNRGQILPYDLVLGDLIDGFYRVTYRDKLNTSGASNFYCTAASSCDTINIMFGYLTVNVREPPTEPPVIGFRGTSANSSVLVSCSAGGGFPEVSSVTLRCGSETVTAQGKSVMIRRVRARLGSSCTCTARHVTNCYVNNTTTVNVVV